ELSYPDPFKYALPNDPSMPHLEDIYASPSEGIFTDSSYDDEGMVADFNNLETTVAEILKKFDFLSVKTASTPIETQKPLVKDEEAADVDVHLYRSMIGFLMYLTASRPDIMFTTIVATSTTVAKYVAAAHCLARYVAAAHCCGQVLWIQNQLLDYGFNFMNTKIYIDNESRICIVKNPVFHSKTKNIDIRHHFIRDAYEKKLIQVLKIHNDDNVADLLTKAFDVSSKELASPKQTALGKDISNPLMAGRVAKKLHCQLGCELKRIERKIEDLESLWKLIKERFKKTEPKNYTDDYLLKTLKTMFEQPDVEANVWRDQKGRYGLAKRYPLTHFTPEKMLNNVRFEVEEESEMSLELLRGGLLGIMDFNILLLLFILSAAAWNYCCIVSTGSVIVNAIRHIS
nr:putative ribonuclease H-like domain-containing protein [Tanacetum cinerariifolium]